MLEQRETDYASLKKIDTSTDFPPLVRFFKFFLSVLILVSTLKCHCSPKVKRSRLGTDEKLVSAEAASD